MKGRTRLGKAARDGMAEYLLVHGAWHGGWCWSRVCRLLRERGHEAHAPTLTGLGDRAHLAHPGIDLDTHVADVAAVVEAEELSDVVLCGHSYGGIVITQLLDRNPEPFRAAVWLDAFIPKDGEALMDNWPPERARQVREEAERTGGGVPPLPPEYFGVMKEEDAAWVARRCVEQPLRTFTQPARLTGAWKSVPRKVCLLAGLHPNSRFKAPEGRGWDVRTIPSGHDVMIDAPEALARALLELA